MSELRRHPLKILRPAAAPMELDRPERAAPAELEAAQTDLDEIDRRQDEILRALDELNARILGVLREHGIAPPIQKPFGGEKVA